MSEQTEKRSKELTNLGLYIIREYNRVTGILSYDPDGLYQDIMDEIDNIFEPEMRAIKDIADTARADIASKDLEIMRLQCELAISNTLNKAYGQIIDMQIGMREALEKGTTDELLKEFEETLPQLTNQMSFDEAYIAFNKAVYERVQNMQKNYTDNYNNLKNWASRTFRAPDIS